MQDNQMHMRQYYSSVWEFWKSPKPKTQLYYYTYVCFVHAKLKNVGDVEMSKDTKA